MIFSGLLMYGAAQKNRFLSIAFFVALFIYLIVGSLNVAFFAINITVIFLLSQILRKANVQLLSSGSILIYSVIIDIISFYFFPQWVINASLSTYIISGLMFNIRSAIPALALGAFITVLQVVEKLDKVRFRKSQKFSLTQKHLVLA